MEKEKMVKIASVVIGIMIAGLLIWIGFRIVSSGRAVQIAPSAISVVNKTTNSFDITFSSSYELAPFARYSVTGDQTNLALIASFNKSESKNTQGEYTYTTTLNLLPCDKPVYYVVQAGEAVLDYSGVPFSQTLSCGGTSATGTTIPSPTSSTRVSTVPTSAPTRVSPTSSPTLAPTSAPQVTPVGSVTDCNYIKDNIGNGYTARDFAQCQAGQATD